MGFARIFHIVIDINNPFADMLDHHSHSLNLRSSSAMLSISSDEKYIIVYDILPMSWI